MRRQKVTNESILSNAYLKSATNQLLKLRFSLSYLEKQLESNFRFCMTIYFCNSNVPNCHSRFQIFSKKRFLAVLTILPFIGFKFCIPNKFWLEFANFTLIKTLINWYTKWKQNPNNRNIICRKKRTQIILSHKSN